MEKRERERFVGFLQLRVVGGFDARRRHCGRCQMDVRDESAAPRSGSTGFQSLDLLSPQVSVSSSVLHAVKISPALVLVEKGDPPYSWQSAYVTQS